MNSMYDKKQRCYYLDNAATTPIDPEVVLAMQPYLSSWYGNASMSYQLANSSKVAMEEARWLLRDIIHAEEGALFFTSGGTEANNWVLRGLVEANNIDYVLTSRLEHMSVLAPLEYMAKKGLVRVVFLANNSKGDIDMSDLETKLKRHRRVLVSLMHGNNEIGNVNDIQAIAMLCDKYGALFHTDMVQTLAYYAVDVASLPISACTGSAHKFHGPKGIGFAYVKKGVPIVPLLYGGNQEKQMRPGTENIPGIIGMAKAMAMQHKHRDVFVTHVRHMKTTFIQALQQQLPYVYFNGRCDDTSKSLPSIVHIGIPTKKHQDTILLHLDMLGIQASAGSACMSGTSLRSHVLDALQVPQHHTVVRFSFSKHNRVASVPLLANKIATLLGRYSMHT